MTGDEIDPKTMLCADKSDQDVALMVRMLLRDAVNHEAVCVIGRDRIMYLSQELERTRAEIQQRSEVIDAAITWYKRKFLRGDSVLANPRDDAKADVAFCEVIEKYRTDRAMASASDSPKRDIFCGAEHFYVDGQQDGVRGRFCLHCSKPEPAANRQETCQGAAPGLAAPDKKAAFDPDRVVDDLTPTNDKHCIYGKACETGPKCKWPECARVATSHES